jgi:hypothetical protein
MLRLPQLIGLFESIHDVVAAEQACKRAGLWCDMIPVPSGLSHECGMALEIDPAEREADLAAWEAAGARLVRLVER